MKSSNRAVTQEPNKRIYGWSWNSLIGITAIAAFAVVGSILLVSSHAATPTASIEAEGGAVSSAASVISDSTASGSRAVKFGTSTGGGGTGGIPAAGSYVQPGTVGYLGSTSALTVYQNGGASPAGCSWQSYGLRCDSDVNFDHVWIKGGIYWTGTGHLTITNSIIEGGDAWYVVYQQNSAGTNANTLMTITDSTLRWPAGSVYPSGTDVGPIWPNSDGRQDIERDDISGMPQGLNPTSNSKIIGNYIHDLFQNGCGSGPCHIDGIFSQGGDNILIQNNYVSAPVRTDVTAGVFFQNLGATNTGVKVYANYILGGAYYNLRNETSVGLDVRNNTFGNSSPNWNQSPGTIGTWTGNIRTDGSSVSSP